VTSPHTAPTVVTQAYAFALDPTAEQVSALRSHVGGSRFAYNALLALVQANWDENRAKKESGLTVTNDDYVSTSHFGCSTSGPSTVTNWHRGGVRTDRAPITTRPSV
jgi:transposase